MDKKVRRLKELEDLYSDHLENKKGLPVFDNKPLKELISSLAAVYIPGFRFGCKNCYDDALRQLLRIKEMGKFNVNYIMKRGFIVPDKKGDNKKTLSYHNSSEENVLYHLSNANNPGNIKKMFTRLPDDIDERVEAYKSEGMKGVLKIDAALKRKAKSDDLNDSGESVVQTSTQEEKSPENAGKLSFFKTTGVVRVEKEEPVSKGMTKEDFEKAISKISNLQTQKSIIEEYKGMLVDGVPVTEYRIKQLIKANKK